MYVCMYVCMYVRKIYMYVHMYMYVNILNVCTYNKHIRSVLKHTSFLSPKQNPNGCEHLFGKLFGRVSADSFRCRIRSSWRMANHPEEDPGSELGAPDPPTKHPGKDTLPKTYIAPENDGFQ